MIIDQVVECLMPYKGDHRRLSSEDLTHGNVSQRQEEFSMRLVREWLERCPRTSIYSQDPPQLNGYTLERSAQGILVKDGVRSVHEFDLFATYDLGNGDEKGYPLIVEVKSLKLNGLTRKIPRALEIGRELFDTDDIGMLIFMPFYTNRQLEIAELQQHPGVRCVDLGYKKKRLKDICKAD